MKKLATLFLLSVMFLSTAKISAHDWTYQVTSVDGKKYFMWTPYVKKIRGIILTSKPNYIAGIFGDTAIRRICEEEQLALVASYEASYKNYGGASYELTAAGWTELQNGLHALAVQSGYPEVEFAPICTHGHSTEGLVAIRLAAYKPSRFFGVIMENAITNSNDASFYDTYNKIGGLVPLVSSRGAAEFTVSHVSDFPWSATKTRMLTMRNAGMHANMIIQPGAGHLGWYPFESQYLARWIKKASQKMIPAGTYATTGEIVLNSNTENSGYLIEIPDTLSTANLNAITVLSYANYVTAGKDIKNAFWFFDQELADYWVTIHKEEDAKTPMIVRFNDVALAVNHAWVPKTLATITSIIDLAATTTPVGLPISYVAAWGAMEINGSVYKASPCKRPIYGSATYDWGLAIYYGSSIYRASEQAQFILYKNITNSTFTYSDITDKQVDAAPFVFGATDSSNPANYYIMSGAVKVNGSNLEIEKFYKGVSTAEVCYSYQGNISSPSDLFNITWKTGVWADPGDYAVSDESDALLSKDASVLIYPNPVSDLLVVDMKGITASSINLLDLAGKTAVSVAGSESMYKLDVSSLNAGMYILQIVSKGNTITSKIVITK